MKRLFVFLVFTLSTTLGISQTREQLDSLESTAASMKEDSNKVKLLSDLCFYTRGVSSDTALHYGKQALQLANRLKWEKGIAQAYNDIAIVFIDKNDYDTAKLALFQALDIRKKLKDELGEAAIYNKLGIITQEQFNLKEALKWNYKALAIYEKLNHTFNLTYVLNNLGVLHFNLREYDKAIEMHNRALALRKQIGDVYGIAASHGNLANVYYESKDTSRAEENWRFAIEHFRKLNKPEELAVQLNNYGGMLSYRKEYEKAKTMLLEAYEIRKQLNDRKALSSVLISLGEAQMMSGDYRGALKSLQESMHMSKEINTGHEKLYGYLKLSKLFTYTGNADSAYHYMTQYALLKDSIFNEELKSEVAEVRAKYELEKKQKQLLKEQADKAILEKKNIENELKVSNRTKWIYSIAGLAIGLTFLILYFSQRRLNLIRAEKDAEIIRERERGLDAVITATEEERKRIAKDLHDGIGQQLGGLKMAFQQLGNMPAFQQETEKNKLADLTKILDDSATEVRSISHQMMPKVLQEIGLIPAIEDMLRKSLGHTSIRFQFEHFGIEERLAERMEISLYRVCQELVNNIIKHSGASEVVVQLFKNKGHIIMMVEDNGKGFDMHAKKDGIGLMNISSRISNLHGDVNYEPSPGSGTVATIRIPL
jgi:signal transduction histidine kinase/Tfp pilus assembly protein PilF